MSDAFLSLWRITRSSNVKLHESLPDSALDWPYTIATVVRMREMIDGFYELPKDKRPPESIWFESDELEQWFDNVFHNKPTQFEFTIDASEVEG